MTDQLRVQALELAQKLFPTQNPQELVASAHTLESYLREGLPTQPPADTIAVPTPTSRVWSTTDILTLTQCSRNVAFFASKLNVMHPVHGAIPFNLLPFQRDTLTALQSHDRVAICSARQMGTTTMLAAYMLWHATFNAGQTILLCCYKFSHAAEFLDRIRIQMEGLPQVIRPGIVRSNKSQIELDNGSQILARTINDDTCRGMAVNMLVIDGASYVSHSVGNAFMINTLPLLTATRSKIVMASSAGQDTGMFHRAMQDPNFHQITLPWQMHPERDTVWADNMRTIISPSKFANEFECQFEPARV